MLKDLKSPYLKLGSEFYSFEKISPLKGAYILDVNRELAKELNIELSDKKWLELLNGSLNYSKEIKLFSMVYGGHQFGHFVPQLGDGRAINIGKIGEFNLQLKGSGVTRYSRGGDGKALLRSSIREYLASEAMHYLGVETTRALAIMGAKQQAYRDNWEETAITLRASRSWVRFGTFEYFSSRNMKYEFRKLAQYVIKESYLELIDTKEDIYLQLFNKVIESSAKLIANWMALGFIHGVLNSDNCSIAGLTIDYGPFAFIDSYDFDYSSNGSDKRGRYRFGEQPKVMKWNLKMLAESFSIVEPIDNLLEVVERFDEIYISEYTNLMRKKLGLKKELKEDIKLISKLIYGLQNSNIDYTDFFRDLTKYQSDLNQLIEKYSKQNSYIKSWLKEYQNRLKKENNSVTEKENLMAQVNPKYTLKNYILEDIIYNISNSNFTPFKITKEMIKNPYQDSDKFNKYLKSIEDKKGKSPILGCSS